MRLDPKLILHGDHRQSLALGDGGSIQAIVKVPLADDDPGKK